MESIFVLDSDVQIKGQNESQEADQPAVDAPPDSRALRDTLTLEVGETAHRERTPSQSSHVRMRTGEYAPTPATNVPPPVTAPEPLDIDDHPLRGVQFAELALEQPVGSGGIAELWQTRHPANDTPFVVKIARDELKGNPHVHAQFDREWRSSRALRHAGLIPHYSRGTSDDGRPFITMELVHGRPLCHFVQHPVTWRFLRVALLQLCDVLSYVHGRGVLHQDLKPSNILVDLKQRRIRVTDFGLARFGTSEPGVTTRSVLGTPSYMAPEQARGLLGCLGPHTDLYTVGVMITELLSGRKPFEDAEDRVVMIKHCTVAPPPLEVRPGINAPTGIAQVVERLLSKSPEARYQTARELKRALHRLDAT